MRTTLCCGLWLGLCCLLGSAPATAGESGDVDQERPLVKKGVLGTVNVLRELDNRTFTNRVTVASNVEGINSKPESTIDGSGGYFKPKLDAATPLILSYTLPGLRTVSSLVICYEEAGGDAPETVRLEGSADGGQTWFEVFKTNARKSEFLKLFRPAKANRLRLTQEGGGGRRTKEVFVYADLDAPALPLFGGPDSGVFSFLRDLWYADKLKLVRSPKNAVWTTLPHGLPEKVLFKSDVATAHDGGFGDAVEKGKRLYLRFDLDKACQMNCGLIGMPAGEQVRCRFGLHPAEFYTANGHLDPSTLQGSSIKDLTGQGWILQKAWDKDPDICKVFRLEHPGKYNQMLVVWDGFAAYENDRWSRLEMFGVEMPTQAGRPARNEPERGGKNP